MATTITATRQVVEDYQRLFVNRRAYTMQSMRPHSETGRHYYFRPSRKGTDIPLMLTDETIRQHLEGKITVGLYAIDPSTQRCKWVAIDADYRNSMEDLLKLQYHLTQDGVEPALEMSKRGGHLWIFLATPLLAMECRIYIHDLALRLGVPVKSSGLADGIEVFPKHDAISAGEFGNAIRGPLGIHRGANRRFWFYGADYTLEEQIAYLNRLRTSHRGRTAEIHCWQGKAGAGFLAASGEDHFNATKNWERTNRIPHFRAHRNAAKGWKELYRAMPIVRGQWPRQERRQSGHSDRRSTLLQMLGWLHQRDDPGCPRSPDSRAAFRLRQVEGCRDEAEAILRCIGAEAIAARVAGAERARNLCPFAGKPGTPAPCETLCGAWVGVRRRGRRTWAIRHVHHRRWPANRVAPSGGGHRSERLTCRRGGAGTGASRDVAQGTDLRVSDYAAPSRCDQRWKAAATGNQAPVSGHSRSIRSGFVRKGQGQSWHGSAGVLFACRGGSRDTEAVSPSGARDNRCGSLRRLFPLPLCQTAAEGRETGVRRRKCHSLTWLNGRSE